jgi:hypothetical protein
MIWILCNFAEAKKPEPPPPSSSRSGSRQTQQSEKGDKNSMDHFNFGMGK